MEFQKKRVLITDGNQAFLMQMCVLMRKMGFKVTPAEDGLEALKLLNLQSVNIVLMDMHISMRDGMKTLKYLKGNKETSNIPVVIISSDDRTETIKKSLENGADAFLSKPVDVNKLNHTLQECLFGASRTKRKYLRIPFNGKVTLNHKDRITEIAGETLSERGIYLMTHEPSPVGAYVEVAFRLGDGTPINQKGTVIYHTGLFESDAEMAPGMAIEFIDDNEEQFMAINSFIKNELTEDISIYKDDSFI